MSASVSSRIKRLRQQVKTAREIVYHYDTAAKLPSFTPQAEKMRHSAYRQLAFFKEELARVKAEAKK